MRKRIGKWLFWGAVGFLALTAGALGFVYSYVTDAATLEALLRREAPRFLPGTALQIGRAHWRPFLGQVTLNQLHLWQNVDGTAFEVARVSWMSIRCDLGALTRGRVEPLEVSVAQPVLRLRRRADGSWNLQGLLADPWPAPPLPREPVVLVKNGTLELCEAGAAAPSMVLRDVELRLSPEGPPGGIVRFEGSARGGPFDSMRNLEGTFDRRSGRVVIEKGELTRLELTDSSRACLPAAIQRDFAASGLSGGEVGVSVEGLAYDPRVGLSRCKASIQLRGASLERPELPFPLTDVAVNATLDEDVLTISHAEGRNGKTAVRLSGRLSASAPREGPLDLRAIVTDLELDERLKRVTPPEALPHWGNFRPEGWVDLGLVLRRASVGEPVAFALTVTCRDVRVETKFFPYPFQHVQGTLVWKGPELTVNLRTLLGGEWLTCTGTILDPGLEARAKLDFRAKSFPVDEALMRALPPEIRKVVEDFQPSGSVRGVVHLDRLPPPTPTSPPEGIVRIAAELDLNERCSIRWSELPYLVEDLTGHLDLRPDRWSFTNMKGRNGAATLAASGEVVPLGPNRNEVSIHLEADHLFFDQQLREALPQQWKNTWDTLNPSGFSRVEAQISGRSDEPMHTHLTIVPEPAETRVQLSLVPVEGTPGGGRLLVLPPMEQVAGTFIYDDGTITMSNVSCSFREAPVSCQWGRVVLHENGGFELGVKGLQVDKLRPDARLREIMPPVMAQFAQRLDDGRTFGLSSDLGIRWSGRRGEPARCDWSDAKVVFVSNTIQSGIPLEQLQGQIDHIHGWSDGRSIQLQGTINLDSVRLAGLQITGLGSPLLVKDGEAHLSNIEAGLLGGKVYGDVHLTLEETPHYQASLQLVGADLARYTSTVPGKQEMRGAVSGRLVVAGRGNDMRTCEGEASASVTQGDLGQLPLFLQLFKVPNLRPPSRTAFDSADVHATISDGRANFDRITFTGDAFSLTGSGTIELQGDRAADLHLTPIYGREERKIPIVGDVMREASSRVFDVHVTGPINALTFRPEPFREVLSPAGSLLRRLRERERTEPSTRR